MDGSEPREESGRAEGAAPLVSVVFITYDRLETLVDTFESLLAATTWPHLETIVCDDASPPAVQEAIRAMPFDQHLLGERNRGLGHNSNKGIRAARGEFVLQLQDDWHCDGPADFIEAGLEVLGERPDVGIVRYRAMQPDDEADYDEHTTASGRSVRIYRPGGQAGKERLYTDNPHLKRREFHEDLGFYLEGVPMTTMELEFCDRFEAQDRWRTAFLPGVEPFDHTGEELSFNPTAKRDALRQRLLDHPVTRWPFRFFLWIRGRKP